MNADAILQAFARHRVDAILIGGMNFFLRHQQVLTFDVDLWVEDSDANLQRVVLALKELGANWGRDESSWGPLPDSISWLRRMGVYCLTSPHGAIDIFREVRGLEGQWAACHARASSKTTASGIPFVSLSDNDMLTCQMALPEGERKLDRIRYLEGLLP